jgi:methionyl-tRNA formyltransferase
MRTVFFCGAESRYGLAHLQPILVESRLEIVEVILATPERWQYFRQKLTGQPPERASWVSRIKLLKQLGKRLPKASPRQILHYLHTRLFYTSGTARARQLCQQYNISVQEVFDVNNEGFTRKLAELKADLFIGAAYPQIFKSQLLHLPDQGVVNSHPSLLPRCRGAHPVFWALASGEKASGVTMHYMEERVDTGSIIAQIRFPVHESDDYQILYNKIVARIPQLIAKTVDFFQDDNRKPLPQDEQQATIFRNEREIHLAIFWSIYSAEKICNLVRAANGRAFFFFGKAKIVVQKCHLSKSNANLTNKVQIPPGTIVDVSNGIAVKVRDGVVNVSEWESLAGTIRFQVGQVLH